MAISEQWAELLEPGLRSIFEIQRDALAARSLIPVLFNVTTSTKAEEHDLGIGGFDDWNEYTGDIEYDNNDQGYKTTYTHKEYSKGFKIERKLVDDDQYNIINKRPKGLALAAMRTREKHAASVFNNAFDTDYAGGDTKPLCETIHPYSPTDATTASNEGTYSLTYDNAVTVRRLMREFVDDRGELITIVPDLILVPPELEDTANKIVKTMRGPDSQQPDNTDYAANLIQDRGVRYEVWDYLTDANAWFMIDSQKGKMALNWFDRIPLEFESDPTGNYRLEARYRGYMRYSYGWSDWRWIYGNNPS